MKKKKIILGTMLVVFIMLMMPAVSAINAENTIKKQAKTTEDYNNINKKFKLDQEINEKISKWIKKLNLLSNPFERVACFVLGVFAAFVGIPSTILGLIINIPLIIAGELFPLENIGDELALQILMIGLTLLGMSYMCFMIAFGKVDPPGSSDNIELPNIQKSIDAEKLSSTI